MRMRLLPCLLLTLCALAAAAPPARAADDAGAARTLRSGGNALQVRVEGVSDPERVALLQRWAAECGDAALTAFGRYPLRTAQVRIREIDSRDPSPVPWGQTRRDDGVAVLLFVRRDASLAQLRADWTAVHELSHLFHPYLGREGRWMAEGLASYYQNVLRARAGLLTQDQAWRALDAGFGRGRRLGAGAALEELGRGGTMRVYWAGAAYWLEADLALRRERGLDLDTLLSRYARCCLDASADDMDSGSPQAFATELDRLGGDGVFMRLYRRYARSREFPDLSAAYAALGLEADGGVLRYSTRADASGLRNAIMSPRKPDAAR
ncbi:M61 glycyl aminopeptidase [Lysobacter sp. cf310]|nr:M61 glycyl aminopeptidase [Lysobacter sp. cf310]